MIDWVSIVRHSRRRFSNYVYGVPSKVRRKRKQTVVHLPNPLDLHSCQSSAGSSLPRTTGHHGNKHEVRVKSKKEESGSGHRTNQRFDRGKNGEWERGEGMKWEFPEDEHKFCSCLTKSRNVSEEGIAFYQAHLFHFQKGGCLKQCKLPEELYFVHAAKLDLS